MANISRQVQEAERLNNQLFLLNFGSKFDEIYRPKDEFSKFDIFALKSEQEYFFELKNSFKYTIGDFLVEGSMIEIDKWDYLKSLTSRTPNVYYLRFFRNGYAIWKISDLSVDNLTQTFYSRKAVTVANNNVYKSKDCLLLPFNGALKVHYYSIKEMIEINKKQKKRGRKPSQTHN